MDIPLVLEQLHPDKEWGPMANSSCTYEQFAAHWPAENGPVPTKEEMETVWRQIERVPKTKQEIVGDLNSWIGQDPNNLQNLVVAYFTSVLQSTPDSLERLGIPVSGEKKPS